MEPQEAADKIRESAEEQEEEKERQGANRFRQEAAIIIGVLAMMLAITSVGGANTGKEMVNSNIQASDTYAFYQAKNIRQTNTQLASDQLEALVVTQPNLSPEAKATIQKRLDAYKATIERYESDPKTGEGKKELLAKAQHFDELRNHAQEQDPNFDFAEALFQISIVLGSVSIVATARWLLGISLVLGGIATVLMLNGFLLFMHLPIG